MKLIARIKKRLGIKKVFPKSIWDAFLQLAMFACAYYGYRLVRGIVDGKADLAFSNARNLIHVEKSLGLFIEPSVQAWATGTGWVLDLANWMYINSHFTITIWGLVYIYFFHNQSFYFVRNMFMIAMFLALVGYVVYPTAPPRFFPELGFHDSVAHFVGAGTNTKANVLFNPYAAVPSMHVGFALMIGFSLAKLVKFKPMKVLWTIYPAVVTLVVISTANHYWLDAALGALTAAVSAYSAKYLLAKARPHSWSFRPRKQMQPQTQGQQA